MKRSEMRERKRQALQLIAANPTLSISAVARHVGVSQTTVSKWFAEAHLARWFNGRKRRNRPMKRARRRISKRRRVIRKVRRHVRRVGRMRQPWMRFRVKKLKAAGEHTRSIRRQPWVVQSTSSERGRMMTIPGAWFRTKRQAQAGKRRIMRAYRR